MRHGGRAAQSGPCAAASAGAAALLAALSFVLVSPAVMPARAFAQSAVSQSDPGFSRWLTGLWPRAEAMGITRATFERATRGLTPDRSLPDLVIPGRPEPPTRAQPEFVQTPADYLRERTLAGLAAQGRRLATTHRATLARIARDFGVPGEIVLAIWGRETGFGAAKLPHNALRVLATQGYLGRRKEMFTAEFLLALKLVQEGDVPPEAMRSSWAGAMGQTQFLPTDFFRYAVDYDGDGRRDIWNSVPDALAATARLLQGKGWRAGEPWAIEMRAPADGDCTEGTPATVRSVRDWLARGYAPAHQRRLPAAWMVLDASLLQPEGIYGPAFLTLKNYFVLKDYNFSDLYVLFVGHLADRIGQGDAAARFATPWSQSRQLRTAEVEELQRGLLARGFYADKVDGRAGMLTRAALGAYQKANGFRLDCWPTSEGLRHMRGGGR